MDDFFRSTNRDKISKIFTKLDNETGTELAKRYEQWLAIMDATHSNSRRDIPEGISDCVSYLVRKSDLERWIDTENLYAERPDHRDYRDGNAEALADYDCSVSYYFGHRDEFKHRIIQIQRILDTDPADRYAGRKNPYDDVHIEFTPEKQTARMVVDAMLPQTLKKLKHKAIVYDRIITSVAVSTVGLDSIPVLNQFLFGQYNFKSNTKDTQTRIDNVLKELEREQCSRRHITWTDQKRNKFW